MNPGNKRVFWFSWALIVAVAMFAVVMLHGKGVWYAIVGFAAAIGYTIIGYASRHYNEQQRGGAAGDPGMGGGPVQQPPVS